MTNEALFLSTGHIVIVEDDEDVRHSTTLMLRARGFTVDVYRSGSELLSNRFLPPADCLLIDYKMPRIDGLELLPRLRAAGLQAPALMITGFFSTTLRKRAQLAGYVDLVEKPAPALVLLEHIAAIIGTKT